MPSARVDQTYTERSSTLKERAEQRAKSLIICDNLCFFSGMSGLVLVCLVLSCLVLSFSACLGPLLLSVRYLLCSCISRHAVLTPCDHIE